MEARYMTSQIRSTSKGERSRTKRARWRSMMARGTARRGGGGQIGHDGEHPLDEEVVVGLAVGVEGDGRAPDVRGAEDAPADEKRLLQVVERLHAPEREGDPGVDPGEEGVGRRHL